MFRSLHKQVLFEIKLLGRFIDQIIPRSSFRKI